MCSYAFNIIWSGEATAGLQTGDTPDHTHPFSQDVKVENCGRTSTTKRIYVARGMTERMRNNHAPIFVPCANLTAPKTRGQRTFRLFWKSFHFPSSGSVFTSKGDDMSRLDYSKWNHIEVRPHIRYYVRTATSKVYSFT